jgi:GT2 family glycosyltransferase
MRASIIIPVRNRPELLQQLLSSLALQESLLSDLEVLVCDDGSTMDLWPALRKYDSKITNLCLLRQESKGPAAARNLGVRESASPVVLFLDSDVLPDRGLILHLVTALDKNPNWMGAEARIEPNGGKEGPLWDSPVCKNGGRYHTAAIAYRRDALIKTGGFDEAFKMPACEDVDVAVRVLQQGPIGFVPEAIVKHPRRRVTLRTHWRWRKFWKYEMILSKRYGFLAFPGRPAGSFPRLKVALAALVTLPGGRFIQGLKHIKREPCDGLLACFYALFDIFCGICALASILFSRVPPRRNYL